MKTNQMRRIILVLFVASVICPGMSGCYYDKASELYPEGACDTTSVTWSKTIQPIMQQQCAYVGCHVGSNPSGGINLGSYAGVREQAANGALLGSVEHQSSYQPMPRGSTKLPDCQIAMLRIWVTAGAPQN